ncbi:hypothetical protein N431DRAFT_69367 [Stipitochalara longipes BDJ]|nr:hypothetical protein N431DRAFT_69367 [Stipitochalara longipes BDJ]
MESHDVIAQMELPMLPVAGIDMNDVANLDLYTQIILLKTSTEEVETLFQDPNPSQQRAIQNWAHHFGYDYEYTLATRTARVVKAAAIVPATDAELSAFNLPEIDSWQDFGVAENDLSGTNEDLGVPDVSLMDDLALWADETFWLDQQAPLETGNNGIQTSHPDALAELPIAKQMVPETSQESISDPIQSDRTKNARPISPSSRNAGRSRKLLSRLNFGRRQSVHSQASSGYQEFVFDSGSSGASSPGTPGRRGPMDAAARAAMKAVKAVKACWRCKFLRKTCSPDNPCLRCPASSTTCKEKSWPAVGCNRGSFKEVLAPLELCPIQDSKATTFYDIFDDPWLTNGIPEQVNKVYQERLNSRAEVLRKTLDASTESQPTTLISYIQSLDTGNMGNKFKGFQVSSLLPISPSIRAAFIPLEECIAAVVYEAIHCRRFDLMFLGEYPQIFPRIVKLLYSAAKYQAKIDSDELIAQSIICLRGSFEAIRMMNDPLTYFSARSHRWCGTNICQIDCIKTLDEHLSLYLNALSKVFFKKENMRTKETWWLSTFYSFAIQGLVRKLIRQLSYTKNSSLATNQYLHLAIRLFIASYGDYDPLIRDYVTLSKGKEADSSYISDLEEAKTAVEQISWASRNIFSSAEYLRDLFEDDGVDIITNDAARKEDISGEVQSTCIDTSHTVSSSFYTRSRPYRPSSLSSMESYSDNGPASPYTANTQNPQGVGDLYHDFHDFPPSKPLTPAHTPSQENFSRPTTRISTHPTLAL